MQFFGHIIRFLVAALVMMFVGWLVPHFSVGGFGSALLLAIIIALLGWIVESVLGTK